MNIQETWTRLERILESIDGAFNQLADAATDDALVKAEKVLEIELPRSFRESYRIHDGTEGHLFIVGPYRLWPLSFIVEENTQNKRNVIEDLSSPSDQEKNGLIRDCIFSSGWTTFADDGGASQLAIDLDPGPKGTTGQIIALYEDGAEYVASNFASFLEGIVDDIESGTLKWEEMAGQYWDGR